MLHARGIEAATARWPRALVGTQVARQHCQHVPIWATNPVKPPQDTPGPPIHPVKPPQAKLRKVRICIFGRPGCPAPKTRAARLEDRAGASEDRHRYLDSQAASAFFSRCGCFWGETCMEKKQKTKKTQQLVIQVESVRSQCHKSSNSGPVRYGGNQPCLHPRVPSLVRDMQAKSVHRMRFVVPRPVLPAKQSPHQPQPLRSLLNWQMPCERGIQPWCQPLKCPCAHGSRPDQPASETLMKINRLVVHPC